MGEKKEETVTITVPKEKPSCYQYEELKRALEPFEDAKKALDFLFENYLSHHIKG